MNSLGAWDSMKLFFGSKIVMQRIEIGTDWRTADGSPAGFEFAEARQPLVHLVLEHVQRQAAHEYRCLNRILALRCRGLPTSRSSLPPSRRRLLRLCLYLWQPLRL